MAFREELPSVAAASAPPDESLRLAVEAGLVPVATAELTVERTGDAEHGFAWRCRRTGRAPGKTRCRELDSLALPPAWTEVRAARDHRAHIQAVGRDGSGRMQYRYHEGWTRVRETLKARRLAAFADALPRIRERVAEDLKGPIDARETVIALAVRLIDRGLLRVGGERYAATGTAGATTLERRHVAVEGDTVRLAFRAKAGKAARLRLRDARLAKCLARLKGARRDRAASGLSSRLFCWCDGEGTWRRLTGAQVNAYLSAIAGTAVSAKDFRTFAGSSLALEKLEETNRLPARRRVPAAMKAVAERLRNTPAVARSSYVHDMVLALEGSPKRLARLLRGRRRRGLNRRETALARLLQEQSSLS